MRQRRSIRSTAAALKRRHWDPLRPGQKIEYSSAYVAYALVSVVVLFLTAIVTLVLGGQWYFVVLTAVWAAIGLAILMYLCALLALGCIRPKVVLDPSILGIRMAAFFKFTKGTFLVLLGAGLGLYVSATGEYFADDARWAKIGLKDEPWVNMPTTREGQHVRNHHVGKSCARHWSLRSPVLRLVDLLGSLAGFVCRATQGRRDGSASHEAICSQGLEASCWADGSPLVLGTHPTVIGGLCSCRCGRGCFLSVRLKILQELF
jgi:hypothetical protein